MASWCLFRPLFIIRSIPWVLSSRTMPHLVRYPFYLFCSSDKNALIAIPFFRVNKS